MGAIGRFGKPLVRRAIAGDYPLTDRSLGEGRVLRPSDIAARPDLQLGEVVISPSRRRLEGPAGAIQVEPRTMQVLMLLLDANGRVVTRNELFEQCWGGAAVGDDSLNRAIAKVRRTATDVAPGFYEVETIPRTGYRLTGDILGHLQSQAPGETAGASSFSRRALVASGAAITAAAGLGAWWWTNRSRDDEFAATMRQGEQLLDYRDGDAGDVFRRAVSLKPEDPKALGLYAYTLALRTEARASSDIEPASHRETTSQARGIARKALAIVPGEPNAMLAEVLLDRSTLDFAATEDRLRAILSVSPNHVTTMRHLWDFLQCVGRCQDGLNLAERAVAINPLAAGSQFPRAQFLWIVGRTAEADRVIERARASWPDHETVRFAQFTILAFSGRARAALAMLDDPRQSPGFSPQLRALWRINGRALDSPTPENIASARQASVEGSKQRLALSNSACMVMSALGQVDAAFEILSRRYGIPELSAVPAKGGSTAWRFAPWLFTPPVAAVRNDPRFRYICDQIGLTDYWAKRGIKPDYQRA